MGIRFSLLIRFGFCVLAYFLAQRLAFHGPAYLGLLAMIWPAAGIALAALLLSPRRHWPLLLGCLFAAGLAANLTTSRPWLANVGFMAANICETGASAWLVTRLCGPVIRFTQMKAVLALAAAATLINGITAMFGAGVASFITGANFWEFFQSWYVSDGLGLLLLTPMIMVWFDFNRRVLADLRWFRIVELACLFAFSCTVVWLAFMGTGKSMLALHPYMILVGVSWSALRFGCRSTATLMGVIALLVIGITVAGVGCFPLAGADIHMRLLAVQTFLAVMGLYGLMLAATIHHQKEGEQKYSQLVELTGTGFLILNKEGKVVDANAEYVRLTGHRNLGDILGKSVVEWTAAHDRSNNVAAVAQCVESGALRDFRVDYIDEKGGITPVEVNAAIVGEGEALKIISLCRDVTVRKQAEETLQYTQTLLQAVTDGTTDAVFVKDDQGRYLMSNDATARFVGKTGAEFLGKDDTALFPPDDARQVMAGDRRVMASGNVQTYEEWVTCNDGVAHAFQSTKGPVRDARGNVIGLFGISRDVTARKQAEVRDQLAHAVLQRLNHPSDSEDMIRDIIALIKKATGSDSVSIRLREGDDFPYYSQSGKTNPANWIFTPGGSAWTNTLLDIPPDQDPRLHPRNRCVHDGYLSVALIPLRAGDEIVGLLQLNDRRANRLSPEIVRFFEGLATSIAIALKRAQAEGDLQKKGFLLSEAQRLGHVGSWFYDMKGVFQWSAEMYQLYGVDPDTFIPTPESLLNLIHPDDRLAMQTWLTTCISGATHNLQFRINRPDGTTRLILGRGQSAYNAENQLIHMAGTAQDITDRAQAETALATANQELQRTLQELQSNQAHMVQHARMSALGQLAAGIAHDFNNNLMPIVGYADLLLSKPEYLNNQEKARRFIGLIAKSAEDARQVISRIRLIHRSEATAAFMPVNVAEIARSAMQLTAPHWEAELGATSVRIQFSTHLETQVLVLGDEMQLREALTNLILNAADAMPTGGVITLSTVTQAGDVVLSIADTGSGMTEEVKTHCMEPFYTTKGAKGSGLGLAMVAGIMERHKGRVEIDSTPGRGTTIRLRLPAMAIGEPAVNQTSEKPPVDATPAGLRILVAEDDEAGRDLLDEYLKIYGHAVDNAQDGREALEKLSTGTFDLVITDRAMSGANGDAVARAAKTCNPDTPVILLTGFGDLMHDADECPPGVDLVLGKPVSLEDLQHAIRKVMKDHG